ncbi:MAG: glycoside hydrolase family 2 [Methylococcaceae bacterium]|nr:glycoside hydrolase family 2 [Methylococcaceae bacterium]
MRTLSDHYRAISRFFIYWFMVWVIAVVPASSIADTHKISQFESVEMAPRQVISLSGSWQFKPGEVSDTINDFSENDIARWTSINVPANWYLEGKDISGVAWYAKTFTIPHLNEGKRVSLKFSGVDYIAEIWLNGRYIGFHEGYFQAFEFDITNALVFDKENQLIVKVNSPLEKMGEDWSLHKRYIKGIFGHHDTRPGGAWSDRGQEKNTGGIWAPVMLEIHEVALIKNVKVSPQLHLDKHSADANVQMQIDLQQAVALPATIQFTLKPYNFPVTQTVVKEVKQNLTPGFNTFHVPISINDPALWWPWEQGKPNLYQLEIKVIANKQVIDSKAVTFGFRDVQYDKMNNEWKINGQRLFLRGTNYIASQWLSEMTPERFAQDIALMKAANINIVRVHAHVTAEDYYRLCDESGLLNWQDFPLQWGYVDDQDFHNNVIRQASAMVNELFNHPSIIAWSLINEPAWEADWMKEKYHHVNKSQNKALTERLYKTVLPLDKTRYVHPFSASSEHPWLGWYSGHWLDYNQPTNISLVAEYGAQALPNLVNLRKIMSEKDLWPETEEQWGRWMYHNFQPKAAFNIAKIAKGNTPADFVKNTQEYQAKVLKLATESYRRQRYHPVSGIFQFMFVEDWPSMNWGVIDYWRTPKLGYYALQQAYQPVLPSIAWKQENYQHGEVADFDLWVINDLPKDYPNAKVTYSLRNSKTLLETHDFTLDVAADSGLKIKDIRFNNLNLGHYELIFTIADSEGKRLGVNTHEFDVLNSEKTKHIDQ